MVDVADVREAGAEVRLAEVVWGPMAVGSSIDVDMALLSASVAVAESSVEVSVAFVGTLPLMERAFESRRAWMLGAELLSSSEL